jgi:hypothetical protein
MKAELILESNDTAVEFKRPQREPSVLCGALRQYPEKLLVAWHGGVDMGSVPLEIYEGKRLMEERALEVNEAMFFESELTGAPQCCWSMLIGIGGRLLHHRTETPPIAIDCNIGRGRAALVMPGKSTRQDAFECL